MAKTSFWPLFGHDSIGTFLAQIYFSRKSGFVTSFDLFKANLMQKIKEILWLVSEESWNKRTDERTDERQQIYRTNLPKVGASKKS